MLMDSTLQDGKDSGKAWMESVAMPMYTLPVPGLKMPVRTSWLAILHPTLRYPIIPWTYPDPMPFSPDVPTTFPGPIARRPDVVRAWRGDHFNTRRRRGNFDIEVEIDLGESRRTQNCHSTKSNNQTLPHKKPSFAIVGGACFTRRLSASQFLALTYTESKSFPQQPQTLLPLLFLIIPGCEVL
jgi:hypothetical protein